MPNSIDYPEVENNFVKSENEEYQEDKSSTEENYENIGDEFTPLHSDLDFDQRKDDSEDEENNYYSLRENTEDDSKLLIILSIGTLISLGILVNSIFA